MIKGRYMMNVKRRKKVRSMCKNVRGTVATKRCGVCRTPKGNIFCRQILYILVFSVAKFPSVLVVFNRLR